MSDLEAIEREIEREIDELGLREEAEREAAAYTALLDPVNVPGLGMVSGLAAQTLAEFCFGSPEISRCHRFGEAMVHIKPWCHCPKARR